PNELQRHRDTEKKSRRKNKRLPGTTSAVDCTSCSPPPSLSSLCLCASVVQFFFSPMQYKCERERMNNCPSTMAGEAPKSSEVPSPSLFRPTILSSGPGSMTTVSPVSNKKSSLPRTATGDASDLLSVARRSS